MFCVSVLIECIVPYQTTKLLKILIKSNLTAGMAMW